MCTVLEPQGVNQIAVNKYINTSEVTAAYLRTLSSLRRTESSPTEATTNPARLGPRTMGLRDSCVHHWCAYYELYSSTTVLRCLQGAAVLKFAQILLTGYFFTKYRLKYQGHVLLLLLVFSSTFSSSSSSSSFSYYYYYYYYSFSSYVSTVRFLVMHSRCFLLQSLHILLL